MTNLTSLSDFIEADDCSASKNELLERISIVQALLFLLFQEADCASINKYWVAIVYSNLCDSVVPGVALLWIGQFLAAVFVALALVAVHQVSLGYRSSYVFAKPLADESTPLHKKSAEYLV